MPNLHSGTKERILVPVPGRELEKQTQAKKMQGSCHIMTVISASTIEKLDYMFKFQRKSRSATSNVFAQHTLNDEVLAIQESKFVCFFSGDKEKNNNGMISISVRRKKNEKEGEKMKTK